MKKSLLLFIILVTVIFSPQIAGAQTATDTANPSVTKAIGAKQLERQNQLVAALKEKAIKEIDRRITSLNAVLTRLNSMKKLSTDNKTSLTTQVQSQINNLMALKTKIEADTDITTLKADVKSIVDSYRIYALFIPKVHIIASSDVMLDTVDKFNTLYSKLQIRIEQAKAAGKNVTSLETALTDMKVKVDDARTQAQGAQNLVASLKVEEYPGNKTELQKARTMLKTGQQDLVVARKDARTIVQSLKQMKIENSDNAGTNSSSLNKLTQ